ncbi:hypothetical protein [Methylorubrum extorquens]|uniref:Uncharacterized protein n=1 Tax=Methylorubrum extorquens DSM 13060 TaxID=882800 RepID=H1KHR4_METEX|nr:hypothetical protein [Methylorubrum extorquens]EHP92942.1 hypothetical protein MetexDRAFT_2176 [Methylorubrum extorquens DSM 13060]
MSVETLRQQAADACRAYITELGKDLTELCAQGHGGLVTKALTIKAIGQAAEAAGILDISGATAFAEGYVEQASAEIDALRGRLQVTVRLPSMIRLLDVESWKV